MEEEKNEYVPPPPPAGLGEDGIQLWVSIVDVFELNPGELAILAEACSTRDLIVAMERAWIADGRPMTTHGSRNQLVAHPLLSEIRAHRGVYRQLLVSLKLPDPEDNDAEDSASVIILSSGKQRMTASEAGKKGAAKRWSHVR